MSTYQAHARRREKASFKASLREVDPEEFGECAVCGFMHNRPLERIRCPLCGRVLCLGEPVCGCGDGGGNKEYNTEATERPATPGRVPRPVATYSLRDAGGHDAARG